MPGVVIHAQMLSQMLDVMAYQNALYRSLPPWLEAGWLLNLVPHCRGHYLDEPPSGWLFGGQ